MWGSLLGAGARLLFFQKVFLFIWIEDMEWFTVSQDWNPILVNACCLHSRVIHHARRVVLESCPLAGDSFAADLGACGEVL